MKIQIGKPTKIDYELKEATRQWRWVFEIDKYNIGIHQELSWNGQPFRPTTSSYFVASVTKHFHLGEDHGYYDGPHCSFSIGWLHFNWSYWECEKCMPKDWRDR